MNHYPAISVTADYQRVSANRFTKTKLVRLTQCWNRTVLKYKCDVWWSRSTKWPEKTVFTSTTFILQFKLLCDLRVLYIKHIKSYKI